MVIISKSKLLAFVVSDNKARDAVLEWYYTTIGCDWSNYHDIKQTFNSVDNVGNDRYVFNISGNKYRIVAMIHFNKRTLYIRFTGTHKAYDRIDCKNI